MLEAGRLKALRHSREVRAPSSLHPSAQDKTLRGAFGAHMNPAEIAIIAAKQAGYDAHEIVRLIDVLRAGNDDEIFPGINRANAAPTAITVHGALFTRLPLVVC